MLESQLFDSERLGLKLTSLGAPDLTSLIDAVLGPSNLSNKLWTDMYDEYNNHKYQSFQEHILNQLEKCGEFISYTSSGKMTPNGHASHLVKNENGNAQAICKPMQTSKEVCHC